MLNINENLDASFKLKPINKAAVIAIPDLDAPGIKAKHCTTPIIKAPYIVISYSFLFPLLMIKANNKTNAKNKFARAMVEVLKILCSIKSEDKTPINIIGKVAIINKIANFLYSSRLVLYATNEVTMFAISDLKKYITATNVPAWTAISNDKPKSLVPKIKDGNNKCAELEIGRN